MSFQEVLQAKDDILKNNRELEEKIKSHIDVYGNKFKMDINSFSDRIQKVTDSNEKFMKTLPNINYKLSKIDQIEKFNVRTDHKLTSFEVRISAILEQIEKIKTKGFVYNSHLNCLEGQFNGKDAMVLVVDNHGLAYRVCVVYPEISEYRIRTEYNNLLYLLNQNNKYIPIDKNEEIADKENISYEIQIHNKQYEAYFYYISPDIFTSEQIKIIHDNLNILKNPTEEIDIDKETIEVLKKFISSANGKVWLRIQPFGINYLLGIIYDNLENAPYGEDL